MKLYCSNVTKCRHNVLFTNFSESSKFVGTGCQCCDVCKSQCDCSKYDNTVNLCVLFDFDNEWYFLLYYNNYYDITKVEDRMIWVCLLFHPFNKIIIELVLANHICECLPLFSSSKFESKCNGPMHFPSRIIDSLLLFAPKPLTAVLEQH